MTSHERASSPPIRPSVILLAHRQLQHNNAARHMYIMATANHVDPPVRAPSEVSAFGDSELDILELDVAIAVEASVLVEMDPTDVVTAEEDALRLPVLVASVEEGWVVTETPPKDVELAQVVTVPPLLPS